MNIIGLQLAVNSLLLTYLFISYFMALTICRNFEIIKCSVGYLFGSVASLFPLSQVDHLEPIDSGQNITTDFEGYD